jgi:hypothetical protein
MFRCLLLVAAFALCTWHVVGSATAQQRPQVSDGIDRARVFPVRYPDGAVATPRWFSGWENGWPSAEWSGRFGRETYSQTGVTNPGQTEGWRVVRARDLGLTAPHGEKVYQGWLSAAARTESSRAYPVIHTHPTTVLGQSDWNVVAVVPKGPTLYSWYVYNRFDYKDFLSNSANDPQGLSEWFHWATFACQPRDKGTWFTVTVTTTKRTDAMELTRVDSPMQTKGIPQGKWYRVTVYADLTKTPEPEMFMWVDTDVGDGVPGRLWDRGTGSENNPITRWCANADGSDPQLGNFNRFHWGLYTGAGVAKGTLYEDAMQIWSLDRPMTIDVNTPEPASPFSRTIKLGFRHPMSSTLKTLSW